MARPLFADFDAVGVHSVKSVSVLAAVISDGPALRRPLPTDIRASLGGNAVKYPQILLLPLMMFADYFMTLQGAIEREKGHSLHYKIEHYELNPIWQKAIQQRKWFNPRYILLVIILCSVLSWLIEFGGLPDQSIQLLLGYVFVVFGIVLGKHVNNILLFRNLANNPDQISGQITMSHQLVLSVSMFQMAAVLVPLAFVAIFSRSSFAVGGVLGTLMLLVMHLFWKFRARRRRPSRQTLPAVSPDSSTVGSLEGNSPSVSVTSTRGD
jgi:hypothetical protein